MLETTMTVASILTEAGSGMTELIGNGSGVTLVVGMVASVAGLSLLIRWVVRAAKTIRQV